MILLDEAEREHVRQMWLKKVKGRKEKAKLDDLLKMSNKAQLKEVVEWLLSSCHVEFHEGFDGLKGNCYHCWQALLEEAED